MSELTIRNVTEHDLNRCFEIETASYPADEAATKAKILKRIQTYPEGFVVLENEDEIIGFINCGATHKVVLSDEEFKEFIGHDPSGDKVVVMSVVVHPKYQGQGMANKLISCFIEAMKELSKSEIHLICKAGLIDLYAKHGFVYIGESESNHGGVSWHDMSLTLHSHNG